VRIAFRCLVLVASLAVLASSALGQSFNIDLGPSQGTPSNGFSAAANQSGMWDTLGLGTTSNLPGLSGSPTSVSATVTAGYDSGGYPVCGGDIDALLGDNIYTGSGNWSVLFNGLANGTYQVYLYGPRNSSVDTGAIDVNGVSVADFTGDSCSLDEGVAYAVAENVEVTDGTMTIAGDGTGLSYAGLAGVQLVSPAPPIPTSSPWGLALMAMLLVAAGIGILRLTQGVS